MNLISKKTIPASVFVVAMVALPLFIKGQFYLQSLIYVVLYMYLSSAWNILGGYAGLFALGNGLYLGIGAYVSAILAANYGVTPWIGMFVGGIVAGIMSIIIGLPVFRLKGMYYALATIALMTVFQTVFNTETSILGIYTAGPIGIRLKMTGNALDMQFPGKVGYYYLSLVMLFIMLIVSDLIAKSKLGFYFRSIRANSDAAASLGVDVLRYKLTAHFISAFFTAIGGAIYTSSFLYVNATTVFGMTMSFSIVLFCIVGGANTLWGPVIGAVLLVPVQQALRIMSGARMAALSTLIYGLALCVVIVFMPDGILGAINTAIRKKKQANADKALAAARATAAADGGGANG